jgi:hypothetical protein
VRLSERQLPDIFEVAIRAARIMGLGELPEIYVSGEQMWDALTLGSDERAFIVIGRVLTYFKGDELLFLFAREMGHVRAGHVLWKTASKFLTGSTHMNRSIMGGGLLDALNPARMVENAIDAPLMAWARHSEITADRAGLLAIGNDEIARKVMMSWSLKSFPLYQRLDPGEWLRQEMATDDQMLRLSEMTMSTLPYIARRMRLMREYGASPECQAWRAYIQPLVATSATSTAPAAPAAPAASATAAAPASPAQRTSPDDVVRFACSRCSEPIKVQRAAVEGRSLARVRCPNESCRAVLNLRWPDRQPAVERANQLRLNCAQCASEMLIPRAALAGKESVKVRCPAAKCRSVLEVSLKRAARVRRDNPVTESSHE